MTTDRLLNELERQKRYLSELPEKFEFPLFNVRNAVESQRASGYRTTAAASREIIDNALEAGASNIHVVFDEDMDSGRRSVSSIAFIDDGPGMLADMARYALTWGGGTHFQDHDFIGKFGFGLPNSSINQTKRVEVYTRTTSAEPVSLVVLDITDVDKFGVQTIPRPVPADLPSFVKQYLAKVNWSFDHGTVVVWVKPDRLSYKRSANLKQQMLDDFGITYRYLLRNPERNPEGFTLHVLGQEVLPVDPLFLTPGARFYLKEAEGGAQEIENRSVPVSYGRDPDTGEAKLVRLETPEAIEEARSRGEVVTTLHVIAARFPVKFAALGGTDDDAKARFEIRKTNRGMSFVRASREIQTLDLFPRTNKDKSSGLGSWPLLQSYAYHWGIEVRFGPELDEAMGISNDKQSVRPSEDFWRVLAQAEIDAVARNENRWQREQRETPKKVTSPEEPTVAEEAARAADLATNQRSDVPPRQLHTAREELDKAASNKAAATKGESAKGEGPKDEDVGKARAALEAEAKRRPYRIDFNDVPHGPWCDPVWLGTQLVVWVNRQHQFYKVLYGDVLRLAAGARVSEGLDLFIIALAKSEMTVDEEEIANFLSTRRRYVTSPFLDSALADLAVRMPAPEESVTGTDDADMENVA